MAIIFADSQCAICSERLTAPYVATSGCAFPNGHRLFRYCDAPLHVACVERWADREEFARAYHDQELESWRSGYGTLLHEAPRWFMGSGPSVRPNVPYFVQVRLADWPIRLYTRFLEWDTFVDGGYAEELDGAALARAELVIADVRSVFPNQAALSHAWAHGADR